MDSMEVNKAAAAVLTAGIVFMVAGLVGETLVRPHRLQTTAIKIDVPTDPTAGAAAPTADPPVALELVSADPATGESLVKQQGCIACHSFNEGGKAGIGPNLYGVLGAPHGHMAGYEYSSALKAKAGPWTYDELYEWLKKPSAYAPGTKMSYAGLADPKKRADIIDYLRTLSASPEALPPAPPPDAAPNAPTAGPNTAPTPPTATPIADRLATADVNAGKTDTLRLGCIACHSFNEGGKAGVGPNLYGIVGAPHAHMVTFEYSNALKAHQGPWTYEELDKWLTKPSAYAPGTKMTFVGIPDPKMRADVIDYLHSLAASPEPLPGGATPAAAPATPIPAGNAQPEPTSAVPPSK